MAKKKPAIAPAKKPHKRSRTPLKIEDKPLTAQQIAFCEAFVVHRNGTKAAIEAKYSAKTAQEQSSRLLSIVKVQDLVAKLTEKASKAAEVSAADVLREVGRIALSDIRKAFAENGTLKPIHELDDATAAAIASIEIEALFDGAGKDKVHIGYTQKVKLWDKNSAAEKLMRHLGLFGKDNAQKVDPLTELLALIAERGQRLPIKS